MSARGFWFAGGTVPEETARRRILALWRSGASVERYTDGLLLRLPAPLTISTGRAPGTPLVERETRGGKALAAAPFSAAEWRDLAAQPGSTVLVQDGNAVVLMPGAEEDLSLWLDPGELALCPVRSLGAPPEIALALQPVAFDARKELAGVPDADGGLAEVLDALRRRRQGLPPAGGPSGLLRFLPRGIFTLPAPRADGRRPLFGILTDNPLYAGALVPFITLSWISFLWRDGIGSSGNGSPGRTRAASPSHGAGAIGESLADRLRRLFSYSIMMSELGRLIGRKQARYIARMMRMFEDGQYEEALRHAVPLRGETDGPPPSLALGTPGPRDKLNIQTHQGRGGSALAFGPELHARLQQLYRQSFEQLKERGRLDEAAFVLAELLDASEEAVAFLEAQGKLRLAAELAEARKLPPGLVVRQWFIAGDRDRAMLFARRSGAFYDAITRLEKSKNDVEAAALRVLWAESLAAAGRYSAAVETIWPVPVHAARSLARDWIRSGIALGGTAGARLLARYIAIAPGEREEWEDAAHALLEDEDPETAPERLAFASALGRDENNAEHATTDLAAERALARAAVRTLARDAIAGALHAGDTEYKRLLTLAADSSLRADMPRLPAAMRRVAPTERQHITIEAADATGIAIYDAAILPDGSLLAAMGESGTRWLTRDGRVRASFSEPATRLVLSDSGSRAVGIAARGEVARLCHIDLTTRKAWHWDEAPLGRNANSYDGSLWITASQDEVLALDTHAPHPTALWNSGETGGVVECLARNTQLISALVHSSGHGNAWGVPGPAWEKWEVWHFSTNPFVLRERRRPPELMSGAYMPMRAITPNGSVIVAARQALQSPPGEDNPGALPDPAKPLLLSQGHRVANLGPESIGHVPLEPVYALGWIAVPTWTEDGLHCFLLDETALQVRAIVSLLGPTVPDAHFTARFCGTDLVLCDHAGRLLVLDCETLTLRRNLRANW